MLSLDELIEKLDQIKKSRGLTPKNNKGIVNYMISPDKQKQIREAERRKNNRKVLLSYNLKKVDKDDSEINKEDAKVIRLFSRPKK